MLGKINLNEQANSISQLFNYLHVGDLNDHMLNIITAENRILDFHEHEDSDEMFYIIDGKMQIELNDGLVNLETGDFFIVPKGTVHRPVCKSLVKCLLIERKGTLNQSNTGGAFTANSREANKI